MSKEIEFNLNPEREEEKKYEILSFIDSLEGEFKPFDEEIGNFDFHCLVERQGEFGVLACWDKDEGIDKVSLFRVRILK